MKTKKEGRLEEQLAKLGEAGLDRRSIGVKRAIFTGDLDIFVVSGLIRR
jgi:hypothetical protein